MPMPTNHPSAVVSTPTTSLRTPEAPMTKIRRRVLTPKTLFHGLARELTLLAPTYAKLHLAHPALAAYPTLESLLLRLTRTSPDDAKKELLASLVAIRQASSHRLWGAILLRVFRPMLRNVWKTLYGAPREEKLAILVTAFQEATLRVDPRRDPLRIAMYVRQGTRRRAFVALGRQVSWDAIGFGDDPETVVDPHGLDPTRVDYLRIAARLLRHGALVAHVRDAFPALSAAERTTLYQKLRRRLRDAVEAAQVKGSEGAR